MGPFHGRRKPSSKKSSQPKGDTAEEIAARQARDQFIKDMAAKALPADTETDTGGMHPSRLARADPFSGGQPNKSFSQHRQPERPPRGQRAPDLRKTANKRTFDDSNPSEAGNHLPAKKQRTLDEIRRLKGPAAMRKEEEKRRRKSEVTAEPTSQASSDPPVSDIKNGPGNDDDDDDTPIPSKKGKKDITKPEQTAKTAEEKLQRKAEKAARKAAKKAVTNGVSAEEPTLPAAEAAAKPGVSSEEPNAPQSKEERKKQKREAKASKEQAAVEEPKETPEEKAVRKAAKKDKKARKAAAAAADEESHMKTTSAIASPVPGTTSAAPTTSTNWSQAASSLGSKSSKFMRLLGGAKHGEVAVDASQDKDSSCDQVKRAKKAEKELQKQYVAGVQAKQSGNKRGGLGA